MSRNNYYSTRILLDYSYHQNNYEHTDSSRKNFIGNLEEDDSATLLHITEKKQKIILNFSLDSLNVTESYKQWNIKIALYWMKQVFLDLWQENGTLSMINQKQIMM